MADANFPDSLPDASTVTSSQTLLAADLADQQDTDRNELIALATKLGLAASTPTDVGDVLQVTAAGETEYGPVGTVSLAPAATMLTLATVGPLSSAQANIDFTPPTGDYDCLEIELMIRGTNASASEALQLRFNSDTGSNYDDQVVYAINTTAGGLSAAAAAFGRIGIAASANAPANAFSHVLIRIPFFRSTTYKKMATSETSVAQGTTTGNFIRQDNMVFWRSTAAITSIRLYLAAGNFEVGSVAILRGLPA